MDFEEDTAKPKKQWKQKTFSAPVDNGVFDQLTGILSTLNPNSTDYTSLIEFMRKGFMDQCIQAWSFAAQVNNHSKFTDSTVKLTKVLKIVNAVPELQEHQDPLIKSLLQNTKVMYRGLNNLRPSITNPMLRLMTAIVETKGSIDEFLTYFDLTLPILPKILTPTKAELANVENTKSAEYLSMRFNFVKFWIALVEHTPALLRKDLLIDNKKIMQTWFKHMSIDSDNLITSVLETLKKTVLLEDSFKKVTKCKIFNEFVLSKLHAFYYTPVRANVNEFFLTFIEHASFHDDKKWCTNVTGVSAFRNIKVYNKLVYTLLTFYKPWDDDMQLTTVVTIMEKIPELVAPYMLYLASVHGQHDPKLSSYWIGQTLLLGKIINLDIPMLAEDVPQLNLVMENVLPSPMSKAALTHCLQSEHALVRQLSVQLLVFAFQKYEKVLAMYDARRWVSDKNDIISKFYKQLPDLAVISSVLDGAEGNKLLVLSATLALKHYARNFPQFFHSSSGVYVSIMNQTDLKGIDLVTLDNFLQFQDSQTKWWNPTNGSLSLFTSLLKLAATTTHHVISNKIVHLLTNLVGNTLVFNEYYVSPFYALIHSLQQVEDDPKIWKLLDEVISRCVKTPYKYIDASREHNMCSAFIMALLEQHKYVPEPRENVDSWIATFFRDLAAIGETKVPFEATVPQSANDDSSYFQFVTVAPLSKLGKRLPVNEFDCCGLIARLTAISEDTNKANPKLLDELLSQLGNYLLTDSAFEKTFASRVWKSLFISKFTANGYHISRGLNEIFLQLNEKPVGLNDKIMSLIEDAQFEDLCIECLWSLNDTQLLELLPKVSENVKLHVLQAIASKKVILPQNLFVSTFNKDAIPLYTTILENKCVQLDNVPGIMSLFAGDLVKPLLTYPEVLEYVREHMEVVSDDESVVCVSAAMPTQGDIKEKAIVIAQKALSERDFSQVSFEQILALYTNLQIADEETLKYLLAEYKKFTPLVVKFMATQPTQGPWITKCMLYITKNLAEREILSENFKAFLKEFMTAKWFASGVEAVLEVALSKKWVLEESVMEFVAELLSRCRKLQSNKFMTMFLTNPDAFKNCREHSARIINKLFLLDIDGCSTVTIQEAIVCLYNGTTSEEDTLLLNTLESMEAKMSASWVNYIFSWDLSDGEDSTLISKEREGFIVTLNRSMIQKTIANQGGYDPKFLLLLIINNDELFNGTKFDIRKLLDAHLLQFVIVCLASADAIVQKLAITILSGMISSIETPQVLSVLVQKIVFSYKTNMSPIVWYLVSQITTVLGQPASFLYEKCFRWVLSAPTIRNEVPLLSHILNVEDGETYFKQLQWLLENMLEGLRTKSDVSLLRNRGTYEWLMNQMNQPYMSLKIKQLVLEIIHKTQQIDGDTLVTKFAGVSNVEQQLQRTSTVSARPRDALAVQQLCINNQELAARYAIVVNNSKRLREWVDDDLEQIVKRIRN